MAVNAFDSIRVLSCLRNELSLCRSGTPYLNWTWAIRTEQLSSGSLPALVTEHVFLFQFNDESGKLFQSDKSAWRDASTPIKEYKFMQKKSKQFFCVTAIAYCVSYSVKHISFWFVPPDLMVLPTWGRVYIERFIIKLGDLMRYTLPNKLI